MLQNRQTIMPIVGAEGAGSIRSGDSTNAASERPADGLGFAYEI
jgi:hypothetical protein